MALIIGLISVLLFLFFQWNYKKLEIKNLCDTANGMRASDVIDAVDKMKLRFGSKIPGENITVMVHSTKNMGRSVCTLIFRNGVVIDAKYSEAD